MSKWAIIYNISLCSTSYFKPVAFLSYNIVQDCPYSLGMLGAHFFAFLFLILLSDLLVPDLTPNSASMLLSMDDCNDDALANLETYYVYT